MWQNFPTGINILIMISRIYVINTRIFGYGAIVSHEMGFETCELELNYSKFVLPLGSSLIQCESSRPRQASFISCRFKTWNIWILII